MSYFTTPLNKTFIKELISKKFVNHDFKNSNSTFRVEPNGKDYPYVSITKGNHEFVVISKDDQDKNIVFDNFERETMDYNMIEDLIKYVIDTGLTMGIYSQQSKNSFNFKKLKSFLSDKTIGNNSIGLRFYYGVIAYTKSRSVDSNTGIKKMAEMSVFRKFIVKDDFSLSDVICLDIPIKGVEKLQVHITKIGGEYNFLMATNKNDIPTKVDNYEDVKNIIETTLLKKYQFTIKKYLNIKNAEINQDYIDLVEMITL